MRVRHPAEREGQFRDALRRNRPFFNTLAPHGEGGASLSLAGEKRP
jgi:hypothetical protein